MGGRIEHHTEGVLGVVVYENVSSITGPSHGTLESSATTSSFAIISWSSGSPGWNGDVLERSYVPMVPPDSSLTFPGTSAGEVDANA